MKARLSVTAFARWLMSSLAFVAFAAVSTNCTSPPVSLPAALVLEDDRGKGEVIDLVVIDLSGRELVRRSTGVTDQALSSLHSATAQVAFWRVPSAGSGHELVVWDIAVNMVKVVGTFEGSLVSSPLWSRDGAELISLLTSTPISYMPGAMYEGNGIISITTVATGVSRVLHAERLFVPVFADGKIVAGESLEADKKYTAVDAQSGRILNEFPLAGAVWSVPTSNASVVITFRETTVPGNVTLHAVDAQTGAEIAQLGAGSAGPMLAWPGRTEMAFVSAGDLRAYDHAKNVTRVVGRLETAIAVLGFDPSGRTLLAWTTTEPFYGTFSVEGDHITSAFTMIPRDPRSGLALGLIRIKL